MRVGTKLVFCLVVCLGGLLALFTPRAEAQPILPGPVVQQFIVFNAAPTIIVGGTGMMSARGGGGNQPVIFSSLTTGVCTTSGVNGTVVSGVAAGVCTIAANQASDSTVRNHTYLTAAQVTQSFNIGPITYTVTPSAGLNGSISPATPQTIATGGSSVFTVSPSPGYTAAVGGTCTGELIGNSYATNPITADCTVTASFTLTPVLSAVQSRKTHGAAGTFDLLIDTSPTINGLITVEPRMIGAAHQLVFQFSSAISSFGAVAAIDSNSSSVGTASAVIIGSNIIVTLAGIPDVSRVTVKLNGVNGSVNVAASIGFLVGDVNNTRVVNASDISAIKVRAGQVVTTTNFQYDLDASGSIDATDIAVVKTRSGLGL